MQDNEIVYSVSDFVAVFNQTISYAYSSIVIEGELSDLRISRNRWVYFSLKDESSSVKFFGAVTQLPGPLEEGLILRVRGAPYLHPQYGFSVNIQFVQPVGEGSINRAAKLLEAKLVKEGLFDPSRKRALPYPPNRVGLITSEESAAFHDFIKIINFRWAGLEINLKSVLVQGDSAGDQIIAAINNFNLEADPVDVLVITRGGGSPSELAVFSQESVVRSVAASRIPTLVAIGHEIDISLAEKAADQRASTPSNAAELLTPDKNQLLIELRSTGEYLTTLVGSMLSQMKQVTNDLRLALKRELEGRIDLIKNDLGQATSILDALSPYRVLDRGYAIVRSSGRFVKKASSLKLNDSLEIQFSDGQVKGRVENK